jgi:hypothetical protein
MNVISVASHFYRWAVEVFANTAQVSMQCLLDILRYQWLPVLGAENDVQVIFYE